MMLLYVCLNYDPTNYLIRATNCIIFLYTGFKGNSPQEAIDFMAKYSGKELYEELKMAWVPVVVDGYLLKKAPLELYRSHNFQPVPLMTGVTSDEGAFFVYMIFANKQLKSLRQAKEMMELFVTGVILRNHPRAKEAKKAMWDKYIGNETDLDKVARRLVVLFSDLYFVAPCMQIAKLHSGSQLL